MNILWIGSYASDELLSKMPIRSIGQASGITSQKSIIFGIDQCSNKDIRMCTISAQGFPTYPTYPEKCIERVKWSRNGRDDDISIAFSNRKITRMLSQFANYKKEAANWLKQIPDNEDIDIIVYEPVIERLLTARYLKKHHKNARVHLIVPDIPEFVGNLRSFIKKFLKQVRKRILLHLMKCVDKYIFYAEPMADYYGVNKKNYIVMEGSFDTRESALFAEKEERADDDIVMMYSGAISKGRAVDKFVEVFHEIDDSSLKLWFTGGGDYDVRLKEIEATDKRIHHFGYLNTREEVLSLQSKADVLLHIRDKDAISSKYCFPSKLFEYMASGSVILTVKIPGIPEEYYKYMITLEDITEVSVKDAIEKIRNMSFEERMKFGEGARDYVLTYKSSKTQAERILKFIQD